MGTGARPTAETGAASRNDSGASRVATSALLTGLERARPAEAQTGGSLTGGGDAERTQPPRVPGWLEFLLRIPLPMKLVGANVVLLIAAASAAVIVRRSDAGTMPVLAVMGATLLAALLVNIALVALAVRPITMLEKAVDMIWHGDLAARVPSSLLADRHAARVARMFNILLDGLVADRARTRRLAAELINAGDRERAAISRELHDSTAQSLAALVMQLSVAAQNTDGASHAALRERLETARALATTTLEEVRLLAHTMHPRVLDDLGLVAALRRLARETTAHESTNAGAADGNTTLIEVVAGDSSDERIPTTIASVLYRVAQEAVQNARRHGAPTHIEIRVAVDSERATLEVNDDGIGFNPTAARANEAGIGLFTMRERVALVEGELHVSSRAGGGTSVAASVPLHPPRLAPSASPGI